MATVTVLGSVFDTNTGTHTVTATPAVNDLIVIVTIATGSVATTACTDNNSSGTYNVVKSCVKASSADTMTVQIRTALIASAVSTVFTCAPGTTTGGGIIVYKVTGITRLGSNAARQAAIQSNQASSGTPTPVFGLAALTGNPVIGAVFNASNAATLTPRSSPSYTEDVDTGYNSPTTGIEAMHVASGETGTSIAWGSTSGSAFCSLAVEIDTSTLVTTTITPAVATLSISTFAPTLYKQVGVYQNYTDQTSTFYVDANGVAWPPFLPGGSSPSNTFSGITTTNGTPDATLYQTDAFGAYDVTYPFDNGTYRVTLKFAEIFFTSAGQRVFSVALNGTTVLTSFDIWADVGANAADDKSFIVVASGGTGILVHLISVTDNPKINAITIVPPIVCVPATAALTISSVTSALKKTIHPATSTIALSAATSTVSNAKKLTPSTASITITAATSALKFKLPPAAASLTLSVVTSKLTSTLHPVTAALTLSAVTSALKLTVRPSTSALTLSPVTSTRLITRFLSPSTASLTLTPVTSVLKLAVHPSTATITLTPATSALKKTIRPATASIILTPATSTVSNARILTPSAAAITLTAVTSHLTLTQHSVTSALTLSPVTSALKFTVRPSTATITLSPTTSALTRALHPTTTAIILSPATSTRIITRFLSPSTATITLSPVTSHLKLTLHPAAATITLTPVTSTVSVASTNALHPATAIITLSPVTSHLLSTIRPSAASLTLTPATSGIKRTVHPAPAAFTLTASTTALTVSLHPSSAALILAPATAHLFAALHPSSGVLTLTAATSPLRFIFVLHPSTGIITLTPATSTITNSPALTIPIDRLSLTIPLTGPTVILAPYTPNSSVSIPTTPTVPLKGIL